MEIGPFKIIYQDEKIIAVSKPSGLLIHRSKESNDKVFLLQELSKQIQKYLYPVHRLDRAASGVIIFALSSEVAAFLQKQIQDHDNTIKEYLALVRGSTPDAWENTHPLKNDAKKPQEAKTSFVKLAEFSRCSLLKARIYTGRRHQIRRHLSNSKHQIIGDSSYGKGKINNFFRETYSLPRLFLHARRLKISHPHGHILELEDPLADDLRQFLQRLPDSDKDLIEKL